MPQTKEGCKLRQTAYADLSWYQTIDKITEESPVCTPRMEARLAVLVPATSTSPATQTYCTRVNPTAMSATSGASDTSRAGGIPGDATEDQRKTLTDKENDNIITPTKTSGGVKVDECKSKTKKEQCSFPALDDTTLRNITSPSQNTSCGAIAEEGTPVGSPSTPEQSSHETFTHEELQDKFTMLALAFETNRTTLLSRAEHQKRRRDIGEVNLAREIRELTVMLERQDNENKESQAIARRHCDVVSTALTKMSSRAELHGAVQQELRINAAVEIMVKYVESLKRLYEKELEENKRPLRTASESGSELRRGTDAKKLARRATVSVLINKKTPVKTRQRSVTMETPTTDSASSRSTTPTSSSSAPTTSPAPFSVGSVSKPDESNVDESRSRHEKDNRKQKSPSPSVNSTKKGLKPTLSFKKVDINDNIASGARSPSVSAVDEFRASLATKLRSGLQSPSEWRSGGTGLKAGQGSPPPLPSESSMARRRLTAAVWKGLTRAPSFLNSCVKDSVKDRIRRITAVVPMSKLRAGLSIALVVVGVITLLASVFISSIH